MSQTYVEPPLTPPAPTPAPAGARPAAAASQPEARGKGASPVPHTRGGLPAVPLTVTTVNTMVGLASAAVLTSGPLAAAAATVGTVATSAIATRTARRTAAKAAQRAAGLGRGSTGQRAGHLSLVKPPASRRGSGSAGLPRQPRSTGGTTGRAGSGPAAAPSAGCRGAVLGKAASSAAGSVLKSSPGAGKAAAGRLASRAGEVKAIRQADRAAMPSRAERRTGQTTARRAVADARRTAKTAEKDRRTAQRGRVGRALAKPGKAVRQSLEKARAKNRTAADQRTLKKVTDVRREVRKAPVRREARKRLDRSAARYHGRKLLAAVLSVPLHLIGLLTTPIGHKLDWPWLIQPGLMFYRDQKARAGWARDERDAAIRAELADAEQAIDEAIDQPETSTEAVAETVPRAPRNHNAQPDLTALGGDVPNTAESGFSFSDTASDMYGAAMNYDPDGMMQVLAAIESMPEGLESIANTFRVLAERSDDEFPLDKTVGEALNEVYTLLMQAVSAAEEVGKAFRGSHEGDIARHEDPRNGEEKWDIGNNQ